MNLNLKDDNWKKLPKKTQDRVNKFIDWLKDVARFKPAKDLKKEEVEKQINFTLKCFWVKAEIEYKQLKNKEARDSVRDLARTSARDSARASARTSVRDSARTSARTSAEILLEDNKEFKKKYPNGAFKQLFKLREMWLYPVGILKDTGKFTVYIPPCSMDFPFDD